MRLVPLKEANLLPLSLPQEDLRRQSSANQEDSSTRNQIISLNSNLKLESNSS